MPNKFLIDLGDVGYLGETATEQDRAYFELSCPEVVSEEDWSVAVSAEREDTIHSCNKWHPSECECKGACSCHFVQRKVDNG